MSHYKVFFEKKYSYYSVPTIREYRIIFVHENLRIPNIEYSSLPQNHRRSWWGGRGQVGGYFEKILQSLLQAGFGRVLMVGTKVSKGFFVQDGRDTPHKLTILLEFFKNHPFLVLLGGLAHLPSCVNGRKSSTCSYNVWAHRKLAQPRAHLIGNWMSGSILAVFQ